MNTKRSLNLVRRSLLALDRLEGEGVAVNLIRADLSAVAADMETNLALFNRLAGAVGDVIKKVQAEVDL